MIHVNDAIALDEREIGEDFVRASGPGGQNVNKVSTAVQLRFNVGRSPSLPDDVRARLKKLAGRRVSRDGILVIEAARFRSQARNREDALARLVDLIRRACQTDAPRRPTRPTPAARMRRLDSKQRRGQIKRLRGARPDSAD